MTEGTPAGFADVQAVIDRWRPLSEDEQRRATTRLADASALLRRLVPDLAARAGRDADLAQSATSLVADVVIRFLQNPTGAKQLQETIGPRSFGLTFDGKPVGIFFTEDDLSPLRPSAASPKGATAIGTAFAGVRPGWGPSSPGWGAVL